MEENRKHECNGDCSSCNGDCSSCNGDCSSCSGCSHSKEDFLFKMNPYSSIKKIYGVSSGKGGVGKSLVTSLLAVSLAKTGLKVGIIDADITGPSIAKTFGITTKAYGQNNLIYPYETPKYGIKIISSNMMLENDDDPIMWRGSLISSIIGQFYSDVLWQELDVLLIDMPPGTGDVSLTVFQSIPLDGIISVTTPQDLVSLIVAKSLNMAKTMDVKVLGLVENMSYIVCPDCAKKVYIYGESSTSLLEEKFETKLLGRLPIDPNLTSLVNDGLIESYSNDYLDEIVSIIEKDLKN